MKTSIRILAELGIFCIFLGATTSNSIAESNSTICGLLENKFGVSYVIPDGSDLSKSYVKQLHPGQQSAPWKTNGLFYFYVAENDDQLETVDHFRVATIDSTKGQGDRVRVDLYRSKVDTACHNPSYNWWYGYLREGYGQTSVPVYDQRRQKDNKHKSNDLNSWHFDWLHIRDAQQKCANTAAYVPAIQDDGAGTNDSSPANGLITTPAIAKVAHIAIPVPANLTSMTMVLVHRKKDSATCLGVPVGVQSMPEKTIVNALRFRKKDQRFLGSGMVINWVK